MVKSGIFGMFIKSNRNKKPNSEEVMDSLGTVGTVDLSTNTPPTEPSQESINQTKLIDEKAQQDELRKKAMEEQKKREEEQRKREEEQRNIKPTTSDMSTTVNIKPNPNAPGVKGKGEFDIEVEPISKPTERVVKPSETTKAEVVSSTQATPSKNVEQTSTIVSTPPRNVEPVKPIEPATAKVVEPAKPAVSTPPRNVEPVKPIEPVTAKVEEPAKPAVPTPPRNVEPVKPVEPATAKVVEPAKPAAPTPPRNVEPVKPMEPVTTNIAEPAKSATSTPPRNVEPVKPVEPATAKVVEPTKPAVSIPPTTVEITKNIIGSVAPVPTAPHVPTQEQVAGGKVMSNRLSDEEKKIKEQQESIAKQQQAIRAEQERLEEEKQKLKEEQERLMQQQAAGGVFSGTPMYTNTYGLGSKQTPMGVTKKMVVFVGPNKAGTTFMVNAIAHAMANAKIMTSILDMTRDKGMWYIYSQQYTTSMQKKMANYMQKVSDGEDAFLETVNAHLKVYSAPGSISDIRRGYKHKNIIDVTKNNSNIVLVDADFTTPIDYFDQADEICVVQDLDILKMPDTTLFLRELKNRGMNMKKIRVIVNKYVKTDSLNSKRIVQVMSTYSDPGMTYMESELLPSKVDCSVIPYNINNYTKYTEALCSGLTNYKGYSNDFLTAINDIVTKICLVGGQSRMSQIGHQKKKFFG